MWKCIEFGSVPSSCRKIRTLFNMFYAKRRTTAPGRSSVPLDLSTHTPLAVTSHTTHPSCARNPNAFWRNERSIDCRCLATVRGLVFVGYTFRRTGQFDYDRSFTSAVRNTVYPIATSYLVLVVHLQVLGVVDGQLVQHFARSSRNRGRVVGGGGQTTLRRNGRSGHLLSTRRRYQRPSAVFCWQWTVFVVVVPEEVSICWRAHIPLRAAQSNPERDRWRSSLPNWRTSSSILM